MEPEKTSIYCCGCNNQTQAFLTSGDKVYPHRPDLASIPFWKCPKCNNFVGCHHKSKKPTQPLGFIPTPELKKARQIIHRLIDPLWQPKDYGKRGMIYGIIADKLGKREYHTAKIKTIEEAREVWKIAKNLPALIEERKAHYKAIEDDYLKVKPKEGKSYLVQYGNGWQEGVFLERKDHSCSLHGDLYYDYYFEDKDKKRFSLSIYGEVNLQKRTEEIRKTIKEISKP